jgi:putative phosphoserine phosphatase/1-acylglycerol-3-phosphate O-acyltransferase
MYEAVTQDVDESPPGPGCIAFFDFDGTLLFGYSIFALTLGRVLAGHLAPGEAITRFLEMLALRVAGSEFPELLAEAAAPLAGVDEQLFIDLGTAVFDKYLAAAIYPESRALVTAHLRRGHRVVILSSATSYQVAAVADELGVRDVVCNRLGVRNGRFTGKLHQPLCYGAGKLKAAKKLAKRCDVPLDDCYFYSDGYEDLPLLEAVGFPRPTNPDRLLEAEAKRRQWPVRRFASRGVPGIRELVRTGLVYGAFFSAALQIVPTWMLNRSRRAAVNLAVSTWGEYGSALAGIDIHINGEQHLWSTRPAVFLFNHQSAIDVLIIARLLRRDFTAIAKQEIARNPLVGPVFRVADTVFVDRSNHAKALEALMPVVDALRDGLSVAIAPEGTRSAGRRLGPFKKGPFHIAMQAGVSVVPVVIHNAADVLPKGGFFIRPAEVYVDVLPPVETASWSAATVDRHVADVRKLFLEKLGQWTASPGSMPVSAPDP